ncbi:helix-turn-helix domain-containing protein, partial [Mediterraneibacter agrestimuris]|uniref:helix-turn-helix domain-containing protein n=1 Tax=Mediterraneibacter agrestimuris TaxID=2941333 RepID=UPI00203FD69E
MFDYMSVKEAAEKWGLSERRIQVLCATNRIPNVMRISHVWLIQTVDKVPANAGLFYTSSRFFGIIKI